MRCDSMRMMELALQGYNCSQILILLALEAQGKKNEDLVKSMTGLLSGMGCGRVCGALTGGCCVLGLYAGKGSTEQNADERMNLMLTEFVEWFEQEFGAKYGGINCSEITKDDARLRAFRCPEIVRCSFEKIAEILEGNNYQLEPSRPEGEAS